MNSFPSYEDLRRTVVLSSEASSLQYCIDVGIIRPHQFCDQCHAYMELKPCYSSNYIDGCCWTCNGGRHCLTVRAGSIQHNRSIAFSKFLHLLWMFCHRMSFGDASRILYMNTNTVRSLYKALRKYIAKDLLEYGVIRKIGRQCHIMECRRFQV